jgi:glycosyltransferase involved in cell wall biosynthesis
VRLLGRVPDDALARLYRGARALAYVSLVEGFGLPVLEGFAAGIPVVTSRGTAMEEIAGDAAVLVDPRSEASVEDGLRAVLVGGSERDEIVRRGRDRAALYPWTRTARETWAVYREAADR